MDTTIAAQRHETRREPPDGPCLVCEARLLRDVLQTPPLPVDTNRLFRSAEEARGARRAQLELVRCASCGHIFNRTYDDGVVDYTADYENSQMFSPRFRAYAEELSEELTRRYDVYGKRVVEIGGGRGDFLAVLCAAGGNTGTSFGPSYRPEPGVDTPPGVSFVADYYTEKYADVPADLIVCRHVLEHLESPAEIATAIRLAVGDRETPVYIEVPNADFMLDAGVLWDVVYTHVSYFTKQSLAALFRRAGFGVLRCEERFDGAFIGIELRAAAAEETGDVPDPDANAKSFGVRAAAAVARWSDALAVARELGHRVALWGAGAKAVTFLNAVDAQDVAYVVDVSPRKSGFFLAGTGHRIVQPAHLAVEPPDLVIGLNPAYRAEIAERLGQLAPRAELVFA